MLSYNHIVLSSASIELQPVYSKKVGLCLLFDSSAYVLCVCVCEQQIRKKKVSEQWDPSQALGFAVLLPLLRPFLCLIIKNCR
jgi:hypothetical protein